MRPDWDEQFRETPSERDARWHMTKARRKANGQCWQCAKAISECVCPNVKRAS
jgi:hypothetical protein